MADTPRQLAPTQHAVLFTTAARRSADGARWIVPLHAWVYTPQDSRARKAAFATVLKHGVGVAPAEDNRALFDRRVNLLFADNNRSVRLTVAIAGGRYILPPTQPNGHTRAFVELPADAVASAAPNGRLPVEIVLPAGDARALKGHALLVAPEGLSVISDIDDTVKISHVTDRARLMQSTFVQAFETVPGMGELYSRWHRQGLAVHFVSSSPWHLYAPLAEMLETGGFPPATLTLKQIRLKDRSILDLFKDAKATKPQGIEALLQAYPRRRFVLVGDSGELDPEIYAAIARKHPGRIVQILIRNVTDARADDARFMAAFAGLDPGLWQLFTAPAEIRWQP